MSNKSKLVDDFADILKSYDFTLTDDFKAVALIGGTIKFATPDNIHVSAFAYISDSFDGNFKIKIQRSAGWGSKNSKIITGSLIDAPKMLQEAENIVSSYTSTKQHLLSGNDDHLNQTRNFDEKGFPILKQGESLSDYLHSQDMPAGVVVDQSGLYKTFTSYETDAMRDRPKERHLAHDTSKSYKTIKGAEKLLRTNGYSLCGKQLDNMDLEEFAKSVRTYYNHTAYFSSYWDNDDKKTLGESNCSNGSTSFGYPVKHEDEKYGFLYSVTAVFTDEMTGQNYTKKFNINPENGGVVNSINPYEFEKEIKSLYSCITDKSNACFDKDSRSKSEKIDYHISRYKYNEEQRDSRLDRLKQHKDTMNSFNIDIFQKSINQFQDNMYHHKESYNDLTEKNRQASLDR